MRILAILVLVFGAALAGGTVYFVNKHFDDLNAMNTQQSADTVKVLVAKRKLDYGAKLASGDLQWVEWPKTSVPAGSFTSVEALFGKDKKGKRVVLRSIEANEPILSARITNIGESPRVAMNLGEGKRAVSIAINNVSGVSGFVAPGDRVDILLTRSVENDLVASVILQEVLVIAVDQRSNTEAASPKLGRTVTVEVDTRQAQKLALAQQVGKLSLTLRGFGEDTAGPMAPVTAGELLDLESAPAAKAAPTVRVRRQGKVSNVRIDGTEEGSSAIPPGASGESAPTPPVAN